MKRLSEIFSDLKMAERLNKKGFQFSIYNHPPYTAKWYDTGGSLLTWPTPRPRTSYLTIRMWLKEVHNIFVVVDRPQPDGFYHGRVIVPCDWTRNEGLRFRQYGCIMYYGSFEDAEMKTIERAVKAVPNY